MTRSFTSRSPRRVVRRTRNPAITSLGFTMFRLEGDWPVVVMSSRNEMSALMSL